MIRVIFCNIDRHRFVTDSIKKSYTSTRNDTNAEGERRESSRTQRSRAITTDPFTLR